jgi:hypothetical protein
MWNVAVAVIPGLRMFLFGPNTTQIVLPMVAAQVTVFPD